jgi:ABC-type lipoprotein release transport system permease subunit
MQIFLEIARTGLVAILLHPLRSAVTVAALVAVLLPYLVGLGISQGIHEEAEASIRFGADLYVTGKQFGREVPVPVSVLKDIKAIDGVTDVTPRIVGAIVLGRSGEHAVVVGMPSRTLPAIVTCVEGRLPRASKVNELVVGAGLAQKLKINVGSTIPPFYRNSQGEKLSRVVGIFHSDLPFWQTHLILTLFETAARIFDQPGLATDILVSCRPGYQDQLAEVIQRAVATANESKAAPLRLQVVTRNTLESLLPQGLLHREGIFTLHFLLAFVVTILVVLVTSGMGLSERRREIGILKATGWQTDEILLRGLVESFLLSLAGGAIAIVGAYIWLRGFNGFWVAGVFLPGTDVSPQFAVPFGLTPVPVLLAFLISLIVIMTGTLYSSWRAATVPPWQAMR